MGCGASSALPAYVLSLRSAELERALSAANLSVRVDATAADGGGELTFRSRADFMMRDIIGKGGKSVGVQVAFHYATRQYFAIKFINEERAATERWEVQPLDEMRVNREVTAAQSPFITPLRGFFEEDGVLALVMSYMPGGELFSRMMGRRLGTDEALFYSSELVLGLEALHRLGYIYRDLKPENVLLDEAGHVHICDMGFAIKAAVAYRRLGCVAGRRGVVGRRSLGEAMASCTALSTAAVAAAPCALGATRRASVPFRSVPARRTPQYQAPEISAPDVRDRGYTNAVDWWAFGCLLVRHARPAPPTQGWHRGSAAHSDRFRPIRTTTRRPTAHPPPSSRCSRATPPSARSAARRRTCATTSRTTCAGPAPAACAGRCTCRGRPKTSFARC